MADKIEATAKAVETAGLEKGDKNPSLNLVDIKGDPATKLTEVQSKTATDTALKGFPTVDLVDSGSSADSPRKAENRSSLSAKETPHTAGTGNWAKLEGYTLATEKHQDSPREQNRKSLDTKEPPKFEGTGNWSPLENYTLANPPKPDSSQGTHQRKPVKH
ncbi:hypothetical protein BH11CYA1_BH11CYA1_39280 [soil metagenome]